MLTVDEALQRVLGAARPPLAERVPLIEALGRVLAETIRSPLDVPPWDNSAMDGFAVISADTGSPPTTLRVLETIGAGSVPTQVVTPGTCSRIMTGAPVPEGADSVLMIEKTDGGRGDSVELRASTSPDQNVRPRGGDVREGQEVLSPGHALDPAAVGLIASLGFPSVMVAQRPRVAILSTGDEVVETGWPLAPGQIYSSNSVTLMGLVIEAGGVPVHCGIAPDSPEGLREALQRCLRCDLVITTGGVSVGDFDFVKDAFDDVGASLDFWKVAMKPGKPLAYGVIGGVPAFGLPGNPVSCMVNFLEFVRPVLRRQLGDPRPFLPVLEARATARVGKRPGRALLSRVQLRQGPDGVIEATPTASQSSGVLMSMVQGDGFTLLGEDDGAVEAGDTLRVQVLRWGWMNREEPGYGW
ncbi:MAG: molybdopterin molybdotransferase MoeA [Alphaproteobacteria bacterium]|nr:molybdopterin molybdotransferase MoeA [Alphaproteobacteria bacterium]